MDFDALLVHFREVQRLHHESRVKEEALVADTKEPRGATSTANTFTAITTGIALGDTAATSTPIELGFLQSEELANPLMANSTQFLIKVRETSKS